MGGMTKVKNKFRDIQVLKMNVQKGERERVCVCVLDRDRQTEKKKLKQNMRVKRVNRVTMSMSKSIHTSAIFTRVRVRQCAISSSMRCTENMGCFARFDRSYDKEESDERGLNLNVVAAAGLVIRNNITYVYTFFSTSLSTTSLASLFSLPFTSFPQSKSGSWGKILGPITYHGNFDRVAHVHSVSLLLRDFLFAPKVF